MGVPGRSCSSRALPIIPEPPSMFLPTMRLLLLLAAAGSSAALGLLGGRGAGQPPRRTGARVAVTGASGLIGSKVTALPPCSAAAPPQLLVSLALAGAAAAVARRAGRYCRPRSRQRPAVVTGDRGLARPPDPRGRRRGRPPCRGKRAPLLSCLPRPDRLRLAPELVR